MSYLANDGDCSPSEIDMLTPLPQGMVQRRKANRSLMIGFTAAAFVGIATFASAVEPTTPAPEPTPTPTSSPSPSAEKGDGSGYEGGGSSTQFRRFLRRLESNDELDNRAFITDQTYYGGKLGIQN